jgi:hypothetical protein
LYTGFCVHRFNQPQIEKSENHYINSEHCRLFSLSLFPNQCSIATVFIAPTLWSVLLVI